MNLSWSTTRVQFGPCETGPPDTEQHWLMVSDPISSCVRDLRHGQHVGAPTRRVRECVPQSRSPEQALVRSALPVWLPTNVPTRLHEMYPEAEGELCEQFAGRVVLTAAEMGPGLAYRRLRAFVEQSIVSPPPAVVRLREFLVHGVAHDDFEQG
ncbi:MAG: hypothetical protein IJH84_24585, partial [Saccharopolyspora sp.]|uniref:hypothetical protein n=1 Tax=Saccharopolyspora sp. TaxID=33915 RepID=UPI0025F6237D